MKGNIKFYFLFILSITLLGFKIDETPLEKLLKQLAKINTAYPQEKVHLHFDKLYYAIGEDIWLKAYLVTTEKNEPSFLSKVLYVDLIDDKNQIKKRLTLPVEKGLAQGNISLLDTLSAGTYRIRSYTNYMRNYNADFFFEKFIIIGNVADPKTEKKIGDKKLDFTVHFFPEGGNLINGIRSKIGFKAVKTDGLGANLNGYVINKNKQKVAEFSTEHAGMGAFALMPQANEQYTAIVTLADNTTKSFKLPDVMESGHSLAVNTAAENLSIRIASTADLVNGKDVYVIGQANGKSYISFTSKVDNQNLVATFKKNRFPTGIIQFTLFDTDLNPISERLVFVNHEDALKININLNTDQNIAKRKTEIEISVKDHQDNPIDGNFSVSVTDLNKVPFDDDDEKSILSNLLLTSDLKGFIEKPNYYFNEANPDREKHLDNLLLTQGWRRFVWKDIITNKEPAINFRPEQSLEITGKVTGLNNQPIQNAKILMVSSTPGYSFMLDTVADAKGNFIFDRLDIPDSVSFIIQSKGIKNNKDIFISTLTRPEIFNKEYVGNSIDIEPYVESTKELFKELIKENKLDKGILLKSVTISTAKPKSHLKVPNSANTSGTADYVVTQEELAKETSLIFPLKRIPGMLDYEMEMKSGALRVIIDGNEVDPALLYTFPMSDIAGIELLIRKYSTAVYGGKKIMFVTTKRGGRKPEPATNTAKLQNIGFSATKQFYAPDYDDPKTNQQMQDLRSTIYWNPAVITNNNGNANLNFFNAGTPGIYRVTVEGMDAFGNIGRKVYTYQVKQNL